MPRPVLVTGAAVRIGRALALAFARAGHDVALHYGRSADAAAATATEIRALGVRCETFPADLAAADAAGPLLSAVTGAFPELGTLINSASVYREATLLETDAALFDQQFAVNLRAPFFLTQAFARAVETGHVLNVLDNKIAFNQFAYAAYLLSKKALAELTTMAAMELAPRIRVNAVAPGVVLPATTRSEEYVAWRVEGIPLRLQGSPEHVTQAALSLEQNPFMTGQILFVDGGESTNHIGRNFGEYSGP